MGQIQQKKLAKNSIHINESMRQTKHNEIKSGNKKKRQRGIQINFICT